MDQAVVDAKISVFVKVSFNKRIPFVYTRNNLFSKEGIDLNFFHYGFSESLYCFSSDAEWNDACSFIYDLHCWVNSDLQLTL